MPRRVWTTVLTGVTIVFFLMTAFHYGTAIEQKCNPILDLARIQLRMHGDPCTSTICFTSAEFYVLYYACKETVLDDTLNTFGFPWVLVLLAIVLTVLGECLEWVLATFFRDPPLLPSPPLPLHRHPRSASVPGRPPIAPSASDYTAQHLRPLPHRHRSPPPPVLIQRTRKSVGKSL